MRQINWLFESEINRGVPKSGQWRGQFVEKGLVVNRGRQTPFGFSLHPYSLHLQHIALQ